VQRVWGSLVVVAFWAMAALAVGGPGMASRVGALIGHVSATGGQPVLDRFPARDSRDLSATTTPGPSPGRSQGTTPAPAPTGPAHPASPISGLPAPPPGASAAEQQLAQVVLQAVNADRAAAGLPPLAWSAGLGRSARQHDLAMAAANTLSHQLPGEPALGTRESQQGIRWSWAGENIGYTTDRSTAGALGIDRAMMAEQPPDDGHRRNILTTSGNVIGIDVVLDAAHRRLWLTEDFARV
jgi:uncharacterized protein YkwD